MYETRKTMFDLISKHREEKQKRSTFEELRGVWWCGNVLLIETKTKGKSVNLNSKTLF